jgi:hypothetical protein
MACLAAAAAGAAQAHGPQIQVTAESGKIVTRRMFFDEPYAPLQDVTSIYVLPLRQQSGEWLVMPPVLDTGSGPGIAVGLGYDDMNPGAHPFQPGPYTVSFADGLKKWDGVGYSDSGATRFRLNKNAVTADTTDAGPFNSVTWNINLTSANAHSGLGYRFLGDGSSTTSTLADGIYLVSLKLSHGSLTESDPYYFLLPKNAAAGDLAAALSVLAAQKGVPPAAIQAVVPEPASLALVAAGPLAVAVQHRRFRRARKL